MGGELTNFPAAWAHAFAAAIGAREIMLGGLAAALSVTLFAAFYQYRFFTELRDVESFIDKSLRRARVRVGAPPKHLSARKRRQARIRHVVDEAWRALWQRFWLLAATGLFFPSALLFAVTVNYGTLVPDTAAFADPAQNVPLNALQPPDAALLVLDQFLRGALFDLMEVYRLDTAPLTYSSTSWLYPGLLIIFRGLMSLFTGTLLFVLFKFLRTRFSQTFKTYLRGKSDTELGL